MVRRYEPLMQRFADLVNDELAAQHMTQAEFARRTGVTAKTVNQVLNGRAGASLPMLDYWAHVLGCRWVVTLEPLAEGTADSKTAMHLQADGHSDGISSTMAPRRTADSTQEPT